MGDTDDDSGVSSSRSAADSDSFPVAILELDFVFGALGASRRRYLCYLLHEQSEWSLSDLATEVAAWESDGPRHAVSPQEHDQVYLSLYHVHVPKLVNEEILTFDDRTETVGPGENASRVLSALEGIATCLDSTGETAADRGDGQ